MKIGSLWTPEKYRQNGYFNLNVFIFSFSREVGLVVKDIVIGAGGLGFVPGSVKWDTVSPTVRHGVAQVLSRGDGFRHSLHASASYREYNKVQLFSRQKKPLLLNWTSS